MSDKDKSDDTPTNRLTGGQLYKFTLRDGSIHNEFVEEDVSIAQRMAALGAILAEPVVGDGLLD